MSALAAIAVSSSGSFAFLLVVGVLGVVVGVGMIFRKPPPPGHP